jgi:sulfur carrier protein ThiS
MKSNTNERKPGVHVLVKLDAENTLTVPDNTRVAALSQYLDPRWRDHVIVLVNGRVAAEESILHASDRVVIVPLVAGG